MTKAISTPELVTLAELATRLRISRVTAINHLNHGPPSGSRSGDIRKIKQCYVGKRRFFVADSVDRFIHGRK